MVFVCWVCSVGAEFSIVLDISGMLGFDPLRSLAFCDLKDRSRLQAVIWKPWSAPIGVHLGEPVDPQRITPARGPPLWEAAGQGGDGLLIQPLP